MAVQVQRCTRDFKMVYLGDRVLDARITEFNRPSPQPLTVPSFPVNEIEQELNLLIGNHAECMLTGEQSCP